ncbi:protein TONSOKU-like isoform X2 [Papaver somniferum]|uniref:protein TONSOKU-like isoform X2 n=1 Tax=Papaver somniferum TaxID=3469 RepID=UPI000E6F53F1|nr:protein TONSOKU-like isoform X2 [Papaver somniferum]
MAKDDLKLSSAKRSYRQASSVGNRPEEARWANVIGDILKNRGEYIEALKWLRIDYELSMKYLPEKQLLPTCQSLGEIYLRLQDYKQAKVYQKKHLELANDSGDLIEQQRASTQLGRTYHEMFMKSDDDHSSRRSAKKYFNLAMQLARALKENGAANESSSFLKEYINAHNNVGMLQMDLDNYKEAERILLEGLRICDEEEVAENDDGRSRLHHHLGYLYTQLRKWEKAKDHIQRDIVICKNIGHRQGEAKGYINLGELYYQDQRFEDTKLCYQKALDIARSMEDEDALVNQIQENIGIVETAMRVWDDMGKEVQNLKKLSRNTGTAIARGKPDERKCLLQQVKCLDTLIENSSRIFSWDKHLDFAKKKKKIARDLGDKEMLSDSLLAIGESYHKLRNFQKALKWYRKSWDTSKSIRNLEGQALAKINIGDVLDSQGDWIGALEAFKEGYRIAVQSKVRQVQISALENMHYSYMIRFDNVEEARKLQLKIQEMKKPQNANHEEEDPLSECDETDTEEYDCPSNECNSPEFSECASTRSKSLNTTEDDVPLSSLLRPRKTLSKQKVASVERPLTTPTESSPKSMSNSTGKQKMFSGRKRARLVISDDESDGGDESKYSREKCHIPDENLPTSYDSRKNDGESEFANGVQASFHRIASKGIHSGSTPINHEESNSSYKLGSSKLVVRNDTYFRSFGDKGVDDASHFATSGSKADGDHISDNLLQKRNPADFSDDNLLYNITFRIDDKVIHLDAFSCMVGEMLSIESIKSEVACLYYLQLSDEKRSKGLLPVIRHMMCGGKVLESLEPATLKDYIWGKGWIEVTIDVWVQKRLIKLYIDWCKKLSEAPSIKLLKKLYNLEVSEDEILGSECELQDISVAPLLNALNKHKAIALLDLSHNQLGNETMEKLQQIFVSSSQKYGGLTLDLHCNRFGPTALFQICECPVLFARLEVLNVSGNRLTDGCGEYLSTILGSCKALYSLNIERCSITSRTIQKVAEALSSGSVLSHLSIAHNNPISGNAMISLLSKLATLKRFSDLNLGGIKLSKSVSDSLCQLMQTSCMSSLIVGNTNIGADGALEVAKALSVGPQELNTLDLSFCGITSCHTERLCTNISLIGGILELNLGGNPIGQQGADALVSLLRSPECSLKDLVLNKCNLGLAGIIRILHALTENQVLEELNLEENSDSKKDNTSESDLITQGSLKFLQAEVESLDVNPNSCSLKEVEVTHQEKEECIVNSEIELEVADSEEDLPTKGKAVLSGGFENSCTSSCQKNSSFQGSQLIEELSSSIAFAKHLKLLVLSNNGFTTDVAETLYTSWSSSSGRGLARRHIKDQTIHFSVEGKSCCGIKVCCKRD